MSKEKVLAQTLIEKGATLGRIDNTKPRGALECLEEIGGIELSHIEYDQDEDFNGDWVYDTREEYDGTIEENYSEAYNTIKQALIKAQGQEKALKIIFEKRVDIWHLVDLLDQTYEMYLAFCKSEKYGGLP